MTHLHGADDRLDQIFPAGFEGRNLRPNRSNERAVDCRSIFQTEDVHAHDAFKEVAMGIDDGVRLVHPDQNRHGGVGRGEHVVVNFELSRIVTIARAKIVGDHQRHVALVAVRLCLWGIVEAADAVP